MAMRAAFFTAPGPLRAFGFQRGRALSSGRAGDRSPWAALLPLLSALALLAACGGAPARLPYDREAFARRLLGAAELEVEAPAEWRSSALAVVERLAAAPGPRPRWVELDGIKDVPRGDARFPRLVMVPPEHPLARRALETFGFEALEERGFSIDGRRLTEPRDCLIAVLRDPDRPGRPLTLCVANDGAEYAEGLASLRVGLRPGLLLIRGGELAAQFELADEEPHLRLVLDLELERMNTLQNAAPIQRRGFKAWVPTDTSFERLFEATLGRTEAALERLEALGCPLPKDPPQLFLHTRGDGLHRLFGEVRFVQRSPGSPYVHAWVLPGPPFDDGGGGFAAECASRSLGPCSAGWLDEALSPLAADGFLGSSLEVIASAALRSGKAPSAEELVGDAREVPPAWRAGLRGFLLRMVLDERGDGALEALWRGERPLSADADLEVRFLRALGRAADGQPPPERQRLGDLGLGVGLWLGRRDGGRADELLSGRLMSSIAAAGAHSVRLRVPFARGSINGTWYPEPSEPFGQGCYSDAELLGILSQASAAGLKTVLELEELEGPHGDLLGHQVLAEEASWNAWFDRKEAFSLHAVWLARAAGASLVSLGTDLAQATRSAPDVLARWAQEGGSASSEPELDLRLSALRLQRWRELIARLRAAVAQPLTCCVLNDYQLQQVGFFPELDCVGVEFLGRLLYPGEASLERNDLWLAERLRGLIGEARSVADRAGVPLWFSAVGYPRTDGSGMQPFARQGKTSNTMQRRLLRLFSWGYSQARSRTQGQRQALIGACLWRWPLSDVEDDPRGFQLSPLDQVVRAWLAGP